MKKTSNIISFFLTFLLVVEGFLFQPVNATSDKGRNGTSLVAEISAEPYLFNFHMWEITKTADPDQLTLNPGETGTVHYTLDITKTINERARVSGDVYVENTGDVMTEDLNVDVVLQYKTQSFSKFKDTSEKDTGINNGEELKSGESKYFNYDIPFDPIPEATAYRVVAKISISNHSGDEEWQIGPKESFNLPDSPTEAWQNAVVEDTNTKIDGFTFNLIGADDLSWDVSSEQTIKYSYEITNQSADVGTYTFENTAKITRPSGGPEFGNDSASVDLIVNTPQPPKPTIDPICSENPDQTRRWIVHNPNDTDITFDWYVPETKQFNDDGSITLKSGEEKIIEAGTNPDGSTTLVIEYGNGHKVSSDSSDEQCPILDVDQVCSEKPNTISWTVKNPSDQSIDFEWKILGTDTSSSEPITLDPGDEKTITVSTSPDGPYPAIEVTYGHGQSVISESSYKPCQTPEEPEPGVTPICSENPDQTRRWIVQNPFDREWSFSWYIDETKSDGNDIQHITLLPGQEKIVEAVTNPDGSTTLVIEYGDGHKVSSDSTDEQCPILDVDQVCSEKPNTISWTVKNPSDQSIDFEWKILGTDTSSSEPITLDPGDEKTITVSTSPDGPYPAIEVTYGHGQSVIAESSYKPCQTPEEPTPELDVTPLCSDNPDQERKWKVHNPNDYKIWLNWEIIETGQHKYEIDLESGESTTVTAETYSEGSTTLKVTVTTGEGLVIEAASSDEKCNDNPPPPSDDPDDPPKRDDDDNDEPQKDEPESPELTALCSEDPNQTRRWEVYNPNDEELKIFWEVEETEFESEPVSIPAESSITLETEAAEGNTTTLTVHYGEDYEFDVTSKNQGEPCQTNEGEKPDDDSTDEETPPQPQEPPQEPTEPEDPQPAPPAQEELPNTASPWYNMIFLSGLLLIGSGSILWRLRKN
ncbi:MAG: hypothetical protein H0Z33_09965 [Bacillaceae bacterium]|nr:hypothetical protein [Bacillaceae bacterium]